MLSPFDWHWFAQDWMPIIDIYLLIALAAGLLVGRRSPAARRRNAAIALGFMAVNYTVRAAAHHQAIAEAPRLFGSALPARCGDAVAKGWIDRWPPSPAATVETTRTADAEGGSAPGPGRCLVEIAAMPDFLSPFQWRVIARLSNAYETQHVNLFALRDPAQAEWRLSIRHPNQWTPAVHAAARTHVGTVFLGFSRFPAARSVIDRSGTAVVRWSDMRFVQDAADQRVQRPNLFTALVRIDNGGRVVEEKFGP